MRPYISCPISCFRDALTANFRFGRANYAPVLVGTILVARLAGETVAPSELKQCLDRQHTTQIANRVGYLTN